jgi:hypothetical protein
MIERPFIVVSPPRSGSTLLFETLSRSPALWRVGGESHGVIEGVTRLHPRARGWESNRLGAAAADPATVRTVRRRFHAALRDRDGRRPPPWPPGGLRLLEKTPRNALRIPFLRRVFPLGTFVYLHREPAETMSSMLDGWRSGRYVSYPRLPGWRGSPWLFLVPQWRLLAPDDLAATVGHQWATATRILLDDLAAVPAGQRCVVWYAELVADPRAVIGRLCRRLGVRWNRLIGASLRCRPPRSTRPVPASGAGTRTSSSRYWRRRRRSRRADLVAREGLGCRSGWPTTGRGARSVT